MDFIETDGQMFIEIRQLKIYEIVKTLHLSIKIDLSEVFLKNDFPKQANHFPFNL
jgi:hypothetical protein